MGTSFALGFVVPLIQMIYWFSRHIFWLFFLGFAAMRGSLVFQHTFNELFLYFPSFIWPIFPDTHFSDFYSSSSLWISILFFQYISFVCHLTWILLLAWISFTFYPLLSHFLPSFIGILCSIAFEPHLYQNYFYLFWVVALHFLCSNSELSISLNNIISTVPIIEKIITSFI